MARKPMDLTDDRRSPLLAICWLAWPLFLEQILTTLVSFADTAMVGALGVNATASVSISNSFVFLINGAVIAMGIGITAYVARSVGAKDYDAAKAYIRHAFLILLAMGLPLAIGMAILNRQIPAWMGAAPEIMDDAARYVLITSLFRVFGMATMVLASVYRGRGDTKTPLYINIGVNVLNVVGNYLFINPTHTISLFGMNLTIWGAGWGVAGAAFSTGFSWFVGGSLLAIGLFVKNDPTRLSIRDSFKPDFDLLKRVLHVSFPAMLERICMSTSGIVVMKCIASLGTTVVAANTVFSTAESISFMPAFAFATAATTLVGQSLGAGKPKLAEKYVYYTVGLGAVIMGLAGLGLYVFADFLVALFTPDPEARAIAKECLQIVAIIQPVQTAAWIFAGGLRGAGDTKWPFYITAVCNWGIRTLGDVLAIVVFGLGLPATIVIACVDNTVRAIWTGARFKGGKWKSVIRN